MEVVTKGFLKEDCSHVAVCVEERPAAAVADPNHVSFSKYNHDNSMDDALLKTCFGAGFETVRYGTLSHSHLVLVLRAWLTRAQWDVPEDKINVLRFCDNGGRLDLAAVAKHPNTVEMLEVLHDGIPFEVMSWQMDVEEPTAASAISQALNESQAIALRTTELTAIAVLKGLAIT